MLLLDFSPIIISAVSVLSEGKRHGVVPSIELARLVVLNQIRTLRNRHRKQAVQTIICADGRGNWRKPIFPFYKARREADRDNSFIDWDLIQACRTVFLQELKDFFPYQTIQVEGAEADDVIAVLCRHAYQTDKRSVVLVSSDNDFRQLQWFPNVQQFDPREKGYITEKDPLRFLKEKCIRGDVGDGVPNCMSDDDTFVVPGKRQKVMTAKRFAHFIESDPSSYSAEEQLSFARNKAMVDLLEGIPKGVQEEILELHRKPAEPKLGTAFDYIKLYGLPSLMGSLQDLV